MPQARVLTIAETIDKNKIASDRVWLYALKIYVVDSNGSPVEQLRLVRNAEDVTIDGETYLALPFEIDKSESATELSSLKVSVQDQTRYLQTRLQQYAGCVGFDVDVSVVMMDAGSTTGSLNADLVETYQVVGANASQYGVSLELGAENPLRFLVPKRVQSKDRCTFVYKSTECGYAGGLTTCDYTRDGANGCSVHSNLERFGGYPGIEIRG